MTRYGIQPAAFSDAIHVGRVSKDGKRFLDKEDLTDAVLYAVARYVQDRFGGGMVQTFTSKTDAPSFVLTVKVREAGVEMRGANARDLTEREADANVIAALKERVAELEARLGGEPS